MKPSRPINVARVITRLNVGGPARHVTILSTRLDSTFSSTLLVGEPAVREGSLLEEAVAAGAAVRGVPGLRREISPVNDLRALWWLYRYFRRARPDIVATHTAKAGLLGRLAATLAGVPIRTHTFHGHVLDGYFNPVVSNFYRLLERALSRVTTRVIAVSPAVAQDLIRMGVGKGKLSIIPNGLDLEAFQGAPMGRVRAELGISPEQPLVGIVGRLAPVKNHALFLEAAQLIHQRRPEVGFLIVGDGELAAALKTRVAELGLNRVVYFTGWRRDLPQVYADLDVVVCCSINEGTPVTLIEAGASARPVVATAVGGVGDLVQDGVNGLMVPSGGAASLAQAINRLLSDPGLARRMGVAGQQLAFSRHSATRMVDDVRALYQRLLDSRTMARASRDW